MPGWTPFPHAAAFAFDAELVRKQWKRLHAGDMEPLPTNEKVLAGWVLFHSGKFQRAFDTGMKLGPEGVTLANRAACTYATYLEQSEKVRLQLYQESAERAAVLAAAHPDNVNAHYLHAHALGRYSQGISVAKALAQGIGHKIKASLETTIKLQPKHADAHIALGTFHAEVIDKVGMLIGYMTYGAKKDISLRMMEAGRMLTPKSPVALTEHARALVILEGDSALEEATALWEKAAAIKPRDAVEYLEVEAARAELAD